MYKLYLSSFAVAALLLTGCGSSSDGEDDDDNAISHNQGQSCLSCHAIGGSNEKQFTSGATVYTTLNAANGTTNVATNYTLKLYLESNLGIINYNIGNGIGNVNSTFSTATVNSYTAKVVDANGNIVNSSLTDSHDLGRLDCNSCHTAAGTGGAPGRIVSYDYAASIATPPPTTSTAISFSNDVLPLLTTSCQSCHGTSGNFSVTSSTVTPYTSTTNFVNTTVATDSVLLQRATGVSHGGGTIWSNTSTQYTTVKDWITQGALNN